MAFGRLLAEPIRRRGVGLVNALYSTVLHQQSDRLRVTGDLGEAAIAAGPGERGTRRLGLEKPTNHQVVREQPTGQQLEVGTARPRSIPYRYRYRTPQKHTAYRIDTAVIPQVQM